MLEMIKEAEYELLNYPKRGLGYQLKRALKVLTGRSVEPPDKINWPNGLLAKSLMDYYMQNKNSEEALVIINCLKKYYGRWIRTNHKIYYVDDLVSGMALIDLHQVTGDEKYKKAADAMVQFLYHHERDEAGSFPYRPKQGNGYIFADMIGMVCPFLVKYGSTYGDSNAVNLAVSQIQNFISYVMD